MDAITTPALGRGKSFPLGGSLVAGGANFSVFSKYATGVQLLLFDGVDDDRPSLAFFAPHPGYSSRQDPLGALDEFRDLVKAAHREMHVDGFRFDLAAVLSRDARGRPIASPPVLLDIESDPVLANVKLIAEAWDAAGLYEVGHFAGDAWKEWNGRFRDDIRRFLKGDEGTVYSLACRILGSPDIYGAIGMGATPITAGTVVSKDRRRTRRSSSCATGRSGIFSC